MAQVYAPALGREPTLPNGTARACPLPSTASPLRHASAWPPAPARATSPPALRRRACVCVLRASLLVCEAARRRATVPPPPLVPILPLNVVGSSGHSLAQPRSTPARRRAARRAAATYGREWMTTGTDATMRWDRYHRGERVPRQTVCSATTQAFKESRLKAMIVKYK